MQRRTAAAQLGMRRMQTRLSEDRPLRAIQQGREHPRRERIQGERLFLRLEYRVLEAARKEFVVRAASSRNTILPDFKEILEKIPLVIRFDQSFEF